jgi:hypothetical protein
MSSEVKKVELCGEFWKSIVETADAREFDSDCAACLRARIQKGVERMEAGSRMGPEDLAIAHANLRNFIRLMKINFMSSRRQLARKRGHRVQMSCQSLT